YLDDSIRFLTGHSEVACPVEGCGGIARSRRILLRNMAEMRCLRCSAAFCVDLGVPDERGMFDAAGHSIRIPTYDNEYIYVDMTSLRRIAVVGRLDLFAADVLQQAWITVPPPRHMTIDLQRTTELSDRGLETLLGLRPPASEEFPFSVALGLSQD